MRASGGYDLGDAGERVELGGEGLDAEPERLGTGRVQPGLLLHQGLMTHSTHTPQQAGHLSTSQPISQSARQ